MLARAPAVHPDGGRVKYRLEFHTNRRAGPFLRNIEDALVPAHAVEPGALRGCLPGVRDRDCLPLRLGIQAEIRYTSSTGARLALMPVPRRLRPAAVPSARAVAAGCAASPICFSDSSGAPGSRRT